MKKSIVIISVVLIAVTGAIVWILAGNKKQSTAGKREILRKCRSQYQLPR